jgi:large subunit ribosomal protein L4
MSAVKVVSAAGEAGAEVELPGEIFDARVNVPLIHQVVVAQQAAARQGTHAVKNRGAVRGGGKKPYRQKGTGRARQGSIRAPQFTGGGVVGGPVPRSYAQRTPKKMKVAALRGALSDRARHSRVHVVSGFTEGQEPSTKDALATLTVVTGATPSAAAALVVASAGDQLTWKSLRNARGVHLIAPGQLNTYDVLVSDHVVFTEAALAEFTGRTVSGEQGPGQHGPGEHGPGEQVPDQKPTRQTAASKAADEKPASSEAADEKPASETPASEKAADDKPAAKKPAAQKTAASRKAAAGTEDEQS